MKSSLKKSLQTFTTIFASTLFILGALSISFPQLNKAQNVQASTENSAYLNTKTWQRAGSVIPWNKGELATTEFQQAVDKARNAGLNEVSLHIQLFQSSLTSNELYLSPQTPTDSELTDAISYINSQGLKTSIKFFVDVDYAKGSYWRAYIDPTDKLLWFKNYTTIVKKYAQIAEQNSVTSLSLGTELLYLVIDSKAYNTIGWTKLISDTKTVYTGKLTYGFNHSGENDNNEIKFLDQLDFIGISGYYPIGSNPNATSLEIEKVWDEIIKTKLDPIYNKYKKPIVFTELGYRSITTASSTPWDSNTSGVLSTELQANLYEGLIRSLSKVSYFEGWHIWDWGTTPTAGGISDKSFTPQNKPAEKVLAKYYRYDGGIVPANWEYTPPIVTSTSSPVIISTSTSETLVTSSSTSSDSSAETSSSTTAPSSSSPTSTSEATIPVTLAKPFEINLSQNKENSNKLSLSIQNNQTRDYQNVVLDIEIYDLSGKKVDQVIKKNQVINSNSLNLYDFEYQTQTANKYVIKFGLFDNNWNLIEWINNLGEYSFDKQDSSILVTNSSSTLSAISVTTSSLNTPRTVVGINTSSSNSSTTTNSSTNNTKSKSSTSKTTKASSQTSSSTNSSSKPVTNNNEVVMNVIKVVMGGWTAFALALKK